MSDNKVFVKTIDNSGIFTVSEVIPNRMYKVSFSIRGDAKIQTAVSGNKAGMMYNPVEKLSDNFKQISFKYFASEKAFRIYIYSILNNPASFELENFKLELLPKPVYQNEEIKKTVLEAEDYPGRHGKVAIQNGTSGNKVIWGNNWYHAVSLPSPRTAKSIFIFIQAKSSSSSNNYISIIRDTQPLSKVAMAPVKSWQWTKHGPILPESLGNRFTVYLSADKGCKIFIDKIIISTSKLQTADLEKTEQ